MTACCHHTVPVNAKYIDLSIFLTLTKCNIKEVK